MNNYIGLPALEIKIFRDISSVYKNGQKITGKYASKILN